MLLLRARRVLLSESCVRQAPLRYVLDASYATFGACTCKSRAVRARAGTTRMKSGLLATPSEGQWSWRSET